MAGPDTFSSTYTDLLAVLYAGIDALIEECSERSQLSPAAHRALLAKYCALRQDVLALRTRLGHGDFTDPEYAVIARSFFAEIDALLDVEPDDEDWEFSVGAAMMEAQNRIFDETHWVAGWH